MFHFSKMVALVLFALSLILMDLRWHTAIAVPPNFVVILTDDQGWGDLSLHGNANLSTPNIDRLAQQGAQWDRFYVARVCSPTRAEFLTGRYHPRGNVFGTSAGGERLDLDETTLADVLKSAGYATGAFGKWHNGMQYPYHPNGRGFDEFYGFCSGHWGDYFSPPLEHKGRLVRGEGFVIDDFTNKAMEFIEENKDRPFFCYLPYNTPHSPMQVPDAYWDKFKDADLQLRHRDPEKEDLQHTRAALAMCENIDWNVGRLLNHLDRLDLSRNTVVVFFCDNGPNGWRWNGGMKGRKGSTDEGGVRSPLFIRWPGHIAPGKRISQIAGAIDLLPTFADLAEIDYVHRNVLDGISLKPLLLEADAEWENRILFSHWNGRVSARDPRWRLDAQGQLFDMLDDPGQHHNVAARYPEIAKRMGQTVEDWRKDVFQDDQARPFSLGHPKVEWTQLPARDGEAHGTLRRSNRFPNCSYFTHWTSTKDAITWEVDVPEEGRFSVQVYYACKSEDVGALLELSLWKSRVMGRVSQANEVSPRGMENDRVERMESYVKNFAPMDLGVMDLQKGRGQLKLSALEIPGSEAIEFRQLVFRRIR